MQSWASGLERLSASPNWGCDYSREQTDYRYVLYMTPLQKTRIIPLKATLRSLADVRSPLRPAAVTPSKHDYHRGRLELCLRTLFVIHFLDIAEALIPEQMGNGETRQLNNHRINMGGRRACVRWDYGRDLIRSVSETPSVIKQELRSEGFSLPSAPN